MPDNSANRAAMRASGHSIRCFASFIVPAAIATGTVTNTPTYPATNTGNVVNTTYVTGAHTDVDYGMEVAFFDTATGAFKGRTHVRYGGTISALNLPVREYAQATLNLVSGDTFKVYNEFRLHDKLVAASSAFPPDLRFMTTENDEPEPVVNSGGDWAGMVDGYGTSSELTYASVQMTGSTSFTVYPTAGTVTHVWTLPTGVTFAPGSVSTDANPILRATAGTYTITHTGTDASSGKSRKSHPSIRVHTDADPPYRVLLTSYEGTAEDGWNWEIEVVSGDVSLTAIPDGCKVVLWGRERNNDAWQSFRNASPGRSHLLGVGYVARDTSSGSSDDGVHTVSFEVISPQARMKQITSYSKVMLEDANPDQWSEIFTLGVLRGILQIIQYYMMMGEAGFDLIVDTAFLDERYPAHFLDSTNFYDQIMELAKAVDARLICDRTGRFDLHTHPAYIPLADRAAVTLALTLADTDILDYEWTREHAINVTQMKLSGFSGGASGNLPVFSLYPGGAAGEGGNAPEIARLILDESTPQDDINERAGRYGALADMVLYDEDGIRTKAFDLRLTLSGGYDVFDFYKEYIELTVSDNVRGLDLSGVRFYLLSSSTTMDGDGTSTTDLELRMETNAAEGETYIPPADTTPGGDGQEPPYEPPSTIPISPVILGSGRYIVIGSDGDLYYTTSGNSAVPVWTKVTLSLTGAPSDFIADPFCPLYLGTGTDLWLRATTASRIYKIVFDTSALTATPTSQATIVSGGLYCARIEMERGTANFAVVVVLDTAGDAIKTYATTDGSTWGAAVTINTPSVSFYSTPGLFVSGRTAGKIVTAESKGSGAWVGKVSTNSGVSYSTISSPAIGDSDGDSAFGLHFPYHNNSSESLCFYGMQYGGAGATRYRIMKVNGATQTNISPTFSGSTAGAEHPRTIDSAPNNSLKLVACLRNGTTVIGDPSDIFRVGYCLDGGVSGSSWQYVTARDSTGGTDADTFVRCLGDGSGFISGGGGARLAMNDFEGNSRDMSGNLVALGCATILNIVGW